LETFEYIGIVRVNSSSLTHIWANYKS